MFCAFDSYLTYLGAEPSLFVDLYNLASGRASKSFKELTSSIPLLICHTCQLIHSGILYFLAL